VSAEVRAPDVLAGRGEVSAGEVSAGVVLTAADAVVSAGIRSRLPEQAHRTSSPPNRDTVRIDVFDSSM
jgi:hypothetical protein